MKKIKVILLIAVLVLGCFIAAQRFVGAATATDAAVKIISGPYFTITQTSIRIMWETNIPADSKVEYGLTDAYSESVYEPMPAKSTYNPSPTAPEGINLHEIVITGLESDNVYHYRVLSGVASSEDSTFKTLPKTDDQSFKFAVTSDSHGFGLQGSTNQYETIEPFTKYMLDYQPDFIMDCGDILVGTAFQYEEFEISYFTPAAELIRQFAIFHAHGDHEIGPYYGDFFGTEGSALGLNSWCWNGDWFSYSFNVGNAHFIVLDSNTLEFVPPSFPEAWKEESEWLIADLESDAAKNATWCFIFQHHPYTTEATREYLVPLMEKYDVDILWSGHSHSYSKAVSINPEIGAGNMFMRVGSISSQQGRVTFAPPPPRRGYPNVIAYGRADYGTVEVNGDTVTVRIHSTLPEVGEGPTGVIDEFIIVKEDPQLEYTDIEISPDSIEAGEAITIKTTVKNIGRGLAAVALKIYDNGDPVVQYVIGPKGQERVIVLEPGESEEIEVSLSLYDVGKREIKVADFAPVAVEVTPRIPTFVYSDMEVRVGPGLESDIITVTAAVQNTGSFTGTTTAKMYVNGKTLYSKAITLEPTEKRTLTFFHKFAESGTQLVSVGDLEPKAIEITGTLMLTPIFPDLSGRGNNGIMRGDPGWIDGVVGKAVDFDGVDDYIEVPDSESLHITDELTTIVWGNIDKPSGDATLLAKGISIGYGPNFLIRMLLRGNGIITWGTTYGQYEFFSDGGMSKLGEWAQYLLTYNGTTSNGYINLEQVAQNTGGTTPLNYWAGYPVLTGMSPNGRVNYALGRGSRFGVLDGKVDEIRIYNCHLSLDEMKQIYEHPEELGPRSENLVLWLSFDEIEVQGTHTTEWRQPIAFVLSYVGEKMLWTWNTLVANASIPENATIEAVIQVSDNGKTIKDSQRMVLANGVKSYDISDLEPARYIRIVTEFDTTITDSIIPIPKLEKYAVTARISGTTAEIVWSTKVDWEKGEMTPTVDVFESLSTRLYEIYHTFYGTDK